jgi:putative resolvase
VARLTGGATACGYRVGGWCAGSGPGVNGQRVTLRRVLSDPCATVFVVEYRGRLARFGVERLEAALAAQGRRIVVADPGETTDDLVRDMTWVLTGMCARLYGRRGARNGALRAVTAAQRDSNSQTWAA